MFYFELKKMFGGKKLVRFLLIFLLFTLYCTYIMVRAEGLEDTLLEVTAGLDYLFLVVLCSAIVKAVSLFPMEEENNLSQVLMASRHGKRRLAMTKIAAALFVANIMFLAAVGALLWGYTAVFGWDFAIPIQEAGDFGMEYAADPGVQTYGNLLVLFLSGMFLSLNFTVLLSMFLSMKLHRPAAAVGAIIFLYFVFALLPEIPKLGYVFNLSPICLGMRAVTYKVLFSVGTFSVTVVHVGFAVYMVLIWLLFVKIRNIALEVKCRRIL